MGRRGGRTEEGSRGVGTGEVIEKGTEEEIEEGRDMGLNQGMVRDKDDDKDLINILNRKTGTENVQKIIDFYIFSFVVLINMLLSSDKLINLLR